MENSEILELETKPKLVKELIQELVTLRAQLVVDKETGCNYMFENQRAKDLELMYKVFVRDETKLTPIIHAMKNYIEIRGAKVVQDQAMLNSPEKFTKELLKFKQDVDTLVETSFRNDLKFQKARDNAFRFVMSECARTP